MLGKDLFDVVKSLTKGEKITVRHQLSPKKLQFFDIYAEMEQYSQSPLKAAFPDISSALLATTKRQLLEQILEILWQNTPNNGILSLQTELGKVSVMLKKGLYAIALERVDEVIQAALGLEAMQEIITGLRIKRMILESASLVDKYEERDKGLLAIALGALEELVRVEAAYNKAAEIRFVPVERRRFEVEAMLDELGSLSSASHGRSRIKLFRTQYVLRRILGQHSDCYQSCVAILEILDSQPALMSDPAIRDDFFTNQQFVIAYQIESGDFKAARQSLAKFERTAKRWNGSIDADPSVFGRFSFAEIEMLVKEKKWEGAKSKARKIALEVLNPRQKALLSYKPRWLWCVLYSLFATGEFKTVRRLAFELRENKPIASRDQLFYVDVGIYALAASLAESDEYLGDLVNGITKFYKSIGAEGEYENLMLAFFANASKGSWKNSQLPLLDDLESKLNVLFMNPLFWKHKVNFPVIEWIKSIQSKRSLRELL
jgi:hypothetical protein